MSCFKEDRTVGSNYTKKNYVENFLLNALVEDSNKLNFDCSGCNCRFTSSKDLNDHLDRRPFRCPFNCKQRYAHKNELDSHVKICNLRLKDYSSESYFNKVYDIKLYDLV